MFQKIILISCIGAVFSNGLEIEANKNSTYKDIDKSLNSTDLVAYKDRVYYIDAILQKSYYSALEFCHRHGMELLSIETDDENSFLYKYLKFHIGRDLWIEYRFWTSGAKISDNNWIWMSTGKPVHNANWVDQLDYGDEHCIEVKLFIKYTSLKWFKQNCGEANHVICEKAAQKSTEDVNLKKLF